VFRSARRAIVHPLYQEYQKTLIPSQWKYLPRTVDICAMDPFFLVVDAEFDVVVTAADFEDAFRRLPELISADFDARKLHARSLLKVPMSAKQPACSGPEPREIVVGEASSSSNSLLPDILDLATAVFTCHGASCERNPRLPYLFGWEGIAQHHCSDFGSDASHYWFQHLLEDEPGPPMIEFSASGSEIAAAVVRASGLDDKVATISDMDVKTKDIRFGCSFCPPIYGRNWMRGGYKWHELVHSSFDYFIFRH
jgi:hypothetical protein